MAAVAAVVAAGGCGHGGSDPTPLGVVPQVAPNYPGAAVNELQQAGFHADIYSLPVVRRAGAGANGYAVIHQFPKPGTRVPLGSDVRLVLDVSVNGGGPWQFPPNTRVPNVMGLPIERAFRLIADRGLLVTLRASALPLHTMRVGQQSVTPGTFVHRSTVVTLTLD